VWMRLEAEGGKHTFFLNIFNILHAHTHIHTFTIATQCTYFHIAVHTAHPQVYTAYIWLDTHRHM
jgi:hypothetical protein